MNLGELKSALEGCAPESKVWIHGPSPLIPSCIESWRGNYADASIRPAASCVSEEEIDVAEFIEMIDGALSKSHYGYKGGKYEFSPSTRVWVADHGWSGNCGVSGILDRGWVVFILTEHREF